MRLDQLASVVVKVIIIDITKVGLEIFSNLFIFFVGIAVILEKV